MFVLFIQLLGCVSAEPDYVVDMDTTGTASRCVSATIESVRPTGISSPSVNGVNTRAFARTADGKTVRWDYMRSLQKDGQVRVGDEVFLLLDESGGATGIARACPVNVGREG
ncbi:MAG: hypothetical protein H6737_24065 [Alphaproteobacteria bacterium]|nr:hypothetical protein [Alphaproteobacteria bacterium]